MKLNNFEKCLVVLVTILVCAAGVIKYKEYQNSNKPLQKIISRNIGLSSEAIPENYKELAKQYNVYKDLYVNNEIILTYGYEDVPFEYNMGKDFHHDFTKHLKKENLNFKVIPYKNYQDIKQDLISKYGNQNQGCMMDNGLKEDLNSFLKKTENCLYNVCIIDNKKKEYTIINRNDINYVINILKEYHTN